MVFMKTKQIYIYNMNLKICFKFLVKNYFGYRNKHSTKELKNFITLPENL